MKRLKRMVWSAMALGLMAVVGCDLPPQPGKYTGGGHFASVVPGKKATFGFNLQAIDRNGDGLVDEVKGQLQFNDHGTGVAIHGEVTGQQFNPATGVMEFVGTYNPVGRGAGGTFAVQAVDNGEGGPSAGDSFSVSLQGGEYGGYANSGVLDGGNIQYKPGK